jgi:hypothetical protein
MPKLDVKRNENEFGSLVGNIIRLSKYVDQIAPTPHPQERKIHPKRRTKKAIKKIQKKKAKAPKYVISTIIPLPKNSTILLMENKGTGLFYYLDENRNIKCIQKYGGDVSIEDDIKSFFNSDNHVIIIINGILYISNKYLYEQYLLQRNNGKIRRTFIESLSPVSVKDIFILSAFTEQQKLPLKFKEYQRNNSSLFPREYFKFATEFCEINEFTKENSYFTFKGFLELSRDVLSKRYMVIIEDKRSGAMYVINPLEEPY